MKVLLFTYDLKNGKENLMPWRTLFEVANSMNEIESLHADIANGVDNGSGNSRIFRNIQIVNIPRGISNLAEYVIKNNYDVLFFPIAFKSALNSFDSFKKLNLRKIAYFPGGLYSIKGVFQLLKIKDILVTSPYFFEWIIPKKLLFAKLKKSDFKAVITMSNLSAQLFKRDKYLKDRVYVALPGKDHLSPLGSVDRLTKYGINDKKYLLYAGAPAAIRGPIHLLKAFDKFAEKNKDGLLVMLLRIDNLPDFEYFNRYVEKVRHKDRLILITDKLTKPDVSVFIKMAYGIILPFLLIPSEMPLTYYEALTYGTPVITSKRTGTYDYIKNAVLSSEPGDIDGLCDMMQKLWFDKNLRKVLSEKSFEIMSSHPSWKETADVWINSLDQ